MTAAVSASLHDRKSSCWGQDPQRGCGVGISRLEMGGQGQGGHWRLSF